MDKSCIKIRRAVDSDFEEIWEIFQYVVGCGDTYVYPPDTSKAEARDIWFNQNVQTYVALYNDKVIGTWIMGPNFPGLGSHIANASYMVSSEFRNCGVGRGMAEHSIAMAKEAGYLAMQFNMVVSTNHAAVSLWKSLGFRVIGTSPKAFRHSKLGLVDVYIMYLDLRESAVLE